MLESLLFSTGLVFGFWDVVNILLLLIESFILYDLRERERERDYFLSSSHLAFDVQFYSRTPCFD